MNFLKKYTSKVIAANADSRALTGATDETQMFTSELNEIVKRYKIILAQQHAKRAES